MEQINFDTLKCRMCDVVINVNFHMDPRTYITHNTRIELTNPISLETKCVGLRILKTIRFYSLNGKTKEKLDLSLSFQFHGAQRAKRITKQKCRKKMVNFF